jgi:hypothetical protein
MNNITWFSLLRDLFKSDLSRKDKAKEFGLVSLLALIYFSPYIVILGVLWLISLT